MKSSKGVTLISLIGYILLSIMVLSVLIALTAHFRQNFNDLNVQSVHDVEFDKINLQILSEIKKGKVANHLETTKEKLIFSDNTKYTYVKDDKAIYLNDSIKIAENITNCEFKIIDKNTNKILQITSEIENDKRVLEYLIEELEHDWLQSGLDLKCKNCGRELRIGDYLKYVPDRNAKGITITKEESGFFEIDKNTGRKTYRDQTITQENNMKWRVLATKDTDNNNTNETLVLKMEATLQTIGLGGKAGYINGIEILNRVCRELYSSSFYGSARSINMADINNALDYTPPGGFYYNGSKWTEANGFTTKISSSSYRNQETPDGRDIGSYEISSFFYDIYEGAITNRASGKTTKVNKELAEIAVSDPYWIAYQGALPSNGHVSFGIAHIALDSATVGKYRVWGNYELFTSKVIGDGKEHALSCSFSPIIELGINVPENVPEEYFDKEEEIEHNWRRNGNALTCTNCGRLYTMGMTIGYIPVETNAVTLDSNESGYTAVQTIIQEKKNWEVLCSIDKDGNGTSETLVIRMKPTSEVIRLGSNQLKNNGSDIINRICKELYSSEYGQARCITLNDISEVFQYRLSSSYSYYNLIGAKLYLEDRNLIKYFSSNSEGAIVSGNYWLVLSEMQKRLGNVETTANTSSSVNWDDMTVINFYLQTSKVSAPICPVVDLGLKLPE